MDRDQLLERYIQGNLTPGEQQEFDKLLQDDSGFAGEVKFHTNLKRVIEAEEDGKTRKMVASFESEAGEQARSKRLIPTKWLAAAALVVIAGLGLLLFNNPSQSPGKLFDDYFDPYPNEVVPIVRGAGQDNPRVSAFAAYQNEEYQNAVLLFEHLKTQDPDPVYLFYQANALLQLHRADEALPLLQEHLAVGRENPLVPGYGLFTAQ